MTMLVSNEKGGRRSLVRSGKLIVPLAPPPRFPPILVCITLTPSLRPPLCFRLLLNGLLLPVLYS